MGCPINSGDIAVGKVLLFECRGFAHIQCWDMGHNVC